MRHWQRSDQRLIEFKRTVDHVRLGLQIIWNRVAGVEREPKHALQIPHRFGRRINRHGTTRVRKPPEIIEAHDVIGMRVRENYRVHVANIFAQRLGPEIGPRVYDERTFRSFDINRGAQPVIARIGRPADIAITTNHRHPLRCSGAKESQNQLRALLAKAFGVES